MNNIARKHTDAMTIRLATPEDAAAICDIYSHYVRNTAITFDIEPPTVEELRTKIESIEERYPFLVAEEDGVIVGYSYASAFRPRAAYVHAIETSVYVRQDFKGNGTGRKLYGALEAILRLQHVYTANACISFIDPADEYSPETSRLFHERMGYKLCAHIPNCGRKFDRWYGIIWMQKELISPIPNDPDPFIPLPQLDRAEVSQILADAGKNQG